MTYMMTDRRPETFPTFSAHDLATLLFAGAAATVALDLFGQFISPLLKSFAAPWLGAKLAPVGLAQAVLVKLTGISGKELGALGIPYGLHIMTGLVIYPLGWLIAVRPIWKAVVPKLHWSIPAIGYGVFLWAFALYGMAHLIAGMKPFLGWTSITWVALWGHIIFAVVAAAIIEARRTR